MWLKPWTTSWLQLCERHWTRKPSWAMGFLTHKNWEIRNVAVLNHYVLRWFIMQQQVNNTILMLRSQRIDCNRYMLGFVCPESNTIFPGKHDWFSFGEQFPPLFSVTNGLDGVYSSCPQLPTKYIWPTLGTWNPMLRLLLELLGWDGKSTLSVDLKLTECKPGVSKCTK